MHLQLHLSGVKRLKYEIRQEKKTHSKLDKQNNVTSVVVAAGATAAAACCIHLLFFETRMIFKQSTEPHIAD